MIHNKITSAFLSGAILLYGSQFVAALDADKFAEQLLATLSHNGTYLTYGELSLKDNDIVMSNSFVRLETEKLPLGTILFKNVAEQQNGDYNVETAIFDDLSLNEDHFTLTLDDIKIENLRLPQSVGRDDLSQFVLYDRFSTGPLALTVHGKDAVAFSDAELIVNISSGTMMSMTGAITELSFDLNSLTGSNAKQAAQDMGYDILNGGLEFAAAWNAETGHLDVPLYELSINELGSLNLAVEFGGYTLEFARQVQELQNQIAEQAGNAQAQHAASMALMGMVQQLTLKSASIMFDDQSITNRLFDYFGAQQGMTGQQTVQMAKGFLPFLVGRLGMPDLQSQIIAAASEYFDNPQNLKVSAEPETPVLFGQIVGAAMVDPKTIPDLINLDIQANQ